MKHCNKCNKTKNISSFSLRTLPNKIGRQAWCKPCSNRIRSKRYRNNLKQERRSRKILSNKYRKENVENIRKYFKNNSCIDCGEQDPLVLEFDHMHSKKFNIGDKLSHAPWVTIFKEISKCKVRCANCHRRKTAKEFKWYSYL